MRDSVFDLILKKLEEIDERVRKIENETTKIKTEEEKDPLFFQALEIVKKREETPASILVEKLGIDQKRAEKILDQLAQSGYGETYWGEA